MKVTSGPFNEYRLLPNGEREIVAVHENLAAATESLKKETAKINTADPYKNQGKPVPQEKRDLAMLHVKEMMPDADIDLQSWIVGKAASLIEKDMLYALLDDVAILDEGLAKLDLTGRYRLAALLLS